MNNWRKVLAELDPPEGFIPTNKGMFTSDDLIDELIYSSYAYNRSKGMSVDGWKKITNYGLDDVDVIIKNNKKIDAMERRFQRENSQNISLSWRQKLSWKVINNFEVLREDDPRTELAVGTSFVGSINASYQFLVKKLGKPTYIGNQYKSEVEWFIYFEDEKDVVTIYDYKIGKGYLGDEGLNKEEITDWHIGAHKQKFVEKIYKILNLGD